MRVSTLSILMTVLLLPACGHKPLQLVKPLNPLQNSFDYQKIKDGITVRAKKCNQQDCMRIFGNVGKHLLHGRKAVQPIQLSITNDAQELIILKAHHIGLPLMTHQEITKYLQKSPGWRALGVALASILITTIIATGGLAMVFLGSGFVFSSVPLFTIGASIVGTSPFLLLVGTPIASSITSTEIKKENRLIKRDIKEKMIDNIAVIDEDATKDIIIFVEKKQCKPSFNLRLIERCHPYKETLFTVTLDHTKDIHE